MKRKKKSRVALARQRQRRYRKFLGKPRTRVRGDINLDYKDPDCLQKFLSQQGKLLSRKRTGFTAQQQRNLKLAVKRARYVGLLGSA
jgi:small subunit ribosomal protein S18